MTWLTRMWTVASIELQQRVRGVAWYILLGIFVFVVLVVTVFTTIATANSDAGLASTFTSAPLRCLAKKSR